MYYDMIYLNVNNYIFSLIIQSKNELIFGQCNY